MIFRRKSPAVTRQQALNARPRRLVEAQLNPNDNGGGRLKVPLQPTGWGRWVFRVPTGSSKTFEFDSIGLFVWKLCDGKTSVQKIIRLLAKEYHLNLREAEVPTIRFLSTLAKKGLIGMSVRNKN